MHTPEQLRLQLKQQQRRTRGLGLAHVAVYVAAVVLLLLRMEAPAMVLGAGNAILYFLFVRRLLTRYSQAVTNANLLCGLCQPLEEAWCTENTCMTEGEFEDLKLLPLRRGKGSSLMAHNGFAGNLGQLGRIVWAAQLQHVAQPPQLRTSIAGEAPLLMASSRRLLFHHAPLGLHPQAQGWALSQLIYVHADLLHLASTS